MVRDKFTWNEFARILRSLSRICKESGLFVVHFFNIFHSMRIFACLVKNIQHLFVKFLTHIMKYSLYSIYTVDAGGLILTIVYLLPGKIFS